MRAALILVFCLVPASTRALLVSPEALNEALTSAPLVAEIEVLAVESLPDGTTFLAHRAKAVITRVLRREPSRSLPGEGDEIHIGGPGGEYRGEGVMFPGHARPHTRHRYQAYLSPRTDGDFKVTGFGHGLIPLDGSRAYSRNRTDGSNGEGTGPFLYWDPAYLPIPYFISSQTFAGLPSWIPAIDKSFRTWRDLSGTRLEFIASGCSGSNRNENDGVNHVVLVTKDWPFDPAAIAITRNFYISGDTGKSGLILDSDILLNGVNHAFTVTDEPGKHDIQNIVTHEIGHFLGLGHEVDSKDPDAVMFAMASPNETKKRTLTANDIEGIRSAYGGTGVKLPAAPETASCDVTAPLAACIAVHRNGGVRWWDGGWGAVVLFLALMIGRAARGRPI